MTGLMAYNGPGALDHTSDQQTAAMMALSEAAMGHLATGGDDEQPEAAPLEVAVSSKANWRPNHADLREFTPAEVTRRFRTSAKVTSMDMTPDGCYVVAGCSDGSIRLFSMTKNSQAEWGSEGLLLGQILAKGLITSLIFHVEVTEDGCFAFAGVLRGANEMYAYDLRRLPRDRAHISKEQAESLIDVYVSSDPKLRGFGAAAVVREGEYRLLCGLGIKNLHVWTFSPGTGAAQPHPLASPRAGDEESGEGEGEGESVWECVLDRASNGMSIELLAASKRWDGRGMRMTAVSKSSGQNLRVWDMGPDATGGKDATYRDVSNTQDVRAVFGDYGYGGAGQLALVRLDETLAPLANRMELALPASQASMSGGGRQRRQLCTIKDVVGTHDGSKVLVICSDGGVYGYEGGGRESDDQDKGKKSVAGQLVPYPRLSAAMAEGEDDGTFLSIAKVGRSSVVVLRSRGSEIVVEPLDMRQADPTPSPSPNRNTRGTSTRAALGELDRNVLGDLMAGKGGNKRRESDSFAEVSTSKAKKRSKSTSSASQGTENEDNNNRRPLLLEGGRMLCSAKPAPPPVSSRGSNRPSAAVLALQQQAALALPRRHYDPFAAAMRQQSRQQRSSSGDHEYRGNSTSNVMTRPAMAQAKRAAEEATDKAREFFRLQLENYEVTRLLQPPPTIPPPPPIAPDAQVALPADKTWGEVRGRHDKERQALFRGFRTEHLWLKRRLVEAVDRRHAELHMACGGVRAGAGAFDWRKHPQPTATATALLDTQQQQQAWSVSAQEAFPLGSGRGLTYKKGRPITTPKVCVVEDEVLCSLVANYQDVKARMLRRQQCEADTLWALQCMDLPLLGTHKALPNHKYKVVYHYEDEWSELVQCIGDNKAATSASASASSSSETEGQHTHKEGSVQEEAVMLTSGAEDLAPPQVTAS